MDLKNKKINVLGDSITEGARLDDISQRFTDLLAKNTGAIVRNYGIGGTCIAKSLRPSENPSWDQDFLSRIDAMDNDADIVIVFGGTNDFGHGTVPLGSFDDRSDNSFYGSLHILYTRLIEKYPTSQLVVLTPIHRYNEFKEKLDIFKGVGSDKLKTYVDIIREMSEYYSIPVLDLYATSGIQPSIEINRQTYTADGLHPNALGHKVIAAKLQSFLQSL